MADLVKLAELAMILDEADAAHAAAGTPGYLQTAVVHDCGAPACAYGYWKNVHPEALDFWSSEEEFDITLNEDNELFGPRGCGRAQSAKQAADYIRGFIAARS